MVNNNAIEMLCNVALIQALPDARLVQLSKMLTQSDMFLKAIQCMLFPQGVTDDLFAPW